MQWWRSSIFPNRPVLLVLGEIPRTSCVLAASLIYAEEIVEISMSCQATQDLEPGLAWYVEDGTDFAVSTVEVLGQCLLSITGYFVVSQLFLLDDGDDCFQRFIW